MRALTFDLGHFRGVPTELIILWHLFSNWVFKLEKIDYSFINLNPFLRNVVRRFGQAVEIDGSEIQTMKDCLKHYTEDLSFDTGDTVKVLSGVLKNKKGLVDVVENNFVILVFCFSCLLHLLG